jgi:type I restriction enzyme, R subunit
MNEAETRAELIDPALKAAGWGVVEASRVRREVITLGRLQRAGKPSSHIHGPGIVLYPTRNIPCAVPAPGLPCI